jgi:hypothetical protein
LIIIKIGYPISRELKEIEGKLYGTRAKRAAG